MKTEEIRQIARNCKAQTTGQTIKARCDILINNVDNMKRIAADIEDPNVRRSMKAELKAFEANLINYSKPHTNQSRSVPFIDFMEEDPRNNWYSVFVIRWIRDEFMPDNLVLPEPMLIYDIKTAASVLFWEPTTIYIAKFDTWITKRPYTSDPRVSGYNAHSGPVEMRVFNKFGVGDDELIEMGFEDKLPEIHDLQLNKWKRRRPETFKWED